MKTTQSISYRRPAGRLCIFLAFFMFNFSLSAQNVGIGVADPDAKLEIKGDGTSTGKALKITDDSDNTRLELLDNGRFNVQTVTGGYQTEYLPAHNATYVKATSTYSSNYYCYYGTDNTKSLTGSRWQCEWLSINTAGQKFNIDLGVAKRITRIYLENAHHSGAATDVGIKNFIVYGTNESTAFTNTTYATTTDLTEIGSYQADEHSAADESDPQYFTITTPGTYRYYVFRIADNWGFADYMGIRYIEFQSTQIGTNALVIDSGRVGIGRVPSTNLFEVNGIASKTSAGDWLANSDERIKTDILNIDNAIETIKRLRPVKFKYTDEWMKRNSSIKDK